MSTTIESQTEQDNRPMKIYDDFYKKHEQDAQMTSSTVSSLASPVDSGVQLLDSESEITSVMSNSVFGCDDQIFTLECDPVPKNNEVESYDSTENKVLEDEHEVSKHENKRQNILLASVGNSSLENIKRDTEILPESLLNGSFKKEKIMTKSDIVNQNVTDDYKILAQSVPNYFDKFDRQFDGQNFSRPPKLETQSFSDDVFEMEHPIKNIEPDLMNVSLTSYELLDYTLQNKELPVGESDMHVSLSEEVNENLKLILNNVPETVELKEPIEETVPVLENKVEEQIVFRRQRKKKSKSDTPKKRVSFHEDILNSTKIDDIHINHGFITHEPDVSLSFFQRGFVKKPDVVKGRYSWAAEGDAPYYEKPGHEREIKSDIYINHPRYSSTSSSSSASNSSSIDEEDTDENIVRKEPSLKSKPKSSCLKKTRQNKKYIDTNIVQDEINIKKKKSESNLLDSNIFGSLRNILNFSTSVPLAERGVPEGQEDFTIYSTSHDASNRRKSFGSLMLKNFETIEIKPAEPVNKLSEAKSNLKLTKSEGFYPNYPNSQPNLPANIILCDSNVYEHKGKKYFM